MIVVLLPEAIVAGAKDLKKAGTKVSTVKSSVAAATLPAEDVKVLVIFVYVPAAGAVTTTEIVQISPLLIVPPE